MEEAQLILIIVVAIIVSGIAGIFLGYHLTRDYYKAILIKKGFAEYNTKTGEWKWKDPCDK